MADIFKNIRRFLFGWANSEFLTFLFYLIVAGIFWLLTTLNESFEQELKIPVRIVNVPSNVVITSGESDTLRFNVRDKGFSLITYLYDKNQQPLSIDYRRYAGNNGKGIVPATDLLRLLDARLPASAKAISVKPEQQVFYYNNANIETDMLYYIADTTFSTHEITVYATPEKLDSIHAVYTEPIRQKGLQDSLTVIAHLRPIDGVKMVPAQIKVTFHTDQLTEVRIPDVEVKGVNMPEGKVLRTFPGKLDVTVVTGKKNSQTLTAEDFEIVADYNQFSADSTAQCDVFIRRQPANIKRLQIERQEVDYLIEELRVEN